MPTTGLRLQKVSEFLLEIPDVLRRGEFPLKKFVYICILTFLFAFLSFIGYHRTEPQGMQGSAWLFVSYYGFPLQWLEVFSWVTVSYTRYQTRYTGVNRVNIVWAALILDLTLCFLLALVIVYGTAKLKSSLENTFAHIKSSFHARAHTI